MKRALVLFEEVWTLRSFIYKNNIFVTLGVMSTRRACIGAARGVRRAACGASVPSPSTHHTHSPTPTPKASQTLFSFTTKRPLLPQCLYIYLLVYLIYSYSLII